MGARLLHLGGDRAAHRSCWWRSAAGLTRSRSRPRRASRPGGRASGQGQWSWTTGYRSGQRMSRPGRQTRRGRWASTPSSSRGSRWARTAAPRPLRATRATRRSLRRQFCADSGLEPWDDPQNSDGRFRRVRVRETILPMLEAELGPGIAEALARTATQFREDGDALDHFAEEQIEELAEHAEAGISLGVKALAANPPALRQRIIRLAVLAEFGVSLSRGHTLEVSRLVTEWHGQGALDLPGITVEREGHLLVFSATTPSH